MAYRLPAYLHRNRHGALYFRLTVPPMLREQIGQSEIYRSLGVASIKEASELAQMLAICCRSLFDSLRNQYMSTSDKPKQAINLDRLVESARRARNSIHKSDIREAVQDASFEAHTQRVQEVKAYRKEIELIAAQKTELASLIKGMVAPAPPAPPAPVPAPSKAAPSIDARKLFEEFMADGIAEKRWKNPITARTHDYEPIWNKFVAHADIHGLTKEAAKAYRAEVMAEDRHDGTKDRNLQRAHAVIQFGLSNDGNVWGLDEEMLPLLKYSKGRGGKAGKGPKHDSYLPFSAEELQCLFHSETYRDNGFRKPSMFWLPLLGLYTGARLEELAGLHLSAFVVMDGVPSFHLSDMATTSGGKNDHAPRFMPIHGKLLSAGLLQYRDLVASEGHARLFPDIGHAARDGYAKRATEDFTSYRRSVEVGADAGARSQKAFHSFRSTLISTLFRLGIDGDMRRRLVGHAPSDVHSGVYLGATAIPMQQALEHINRVDFGLDHPVFHDTDAYRKARKRVKATRLPPR